MVVRMKKIENPYVQYMYSYPHKTAYRRLEQVSIGEYLPNLIGRENSLYFHIPFCQYKCGFCNLFSVSGQSEITMEAYVNAMEQHASQLNAIMPESVCFEDLTLGGGTPLILSEKLLRKVFGIANKYFTFSSKEKDIVVETSPNQTTKEKLQLLKEEGVSRVSIGVQSFLEQELKVLKRFHTVDKAKSALKQIREMDFKCMNVDLIYGIPGQTMESLQYSLKQALEYSPEEIFIYPLYVKPGTYLYEKGEKISAYTTKMYWMIRQILQDEGYEPHSMRRYVRRQKKGNMTRQDSTLQEELKASENWKTENHLQLPEKFCGFGNTISIGCGGRSYVGNLHFCTPYTVKQHQCLENIREYMEREDYLQVLHGFLLSVEEQKRRCVIKHILFGKGINRRDYYKHFLLDVLEDFPILAQWEENGYVVMEDEYITLSDLGFSLSDYLGPQLISEEVRKRTEEYYRHNVGVKIPFDPNIMT